MEGIEDKIDMEDEINPWKDELEVENQDDLNEQPQQEEEKDKNKNNNDEDKSTITDDDQAVESETTEETSLLLPIATTANASKRNSGIVGVEKKIQEPSIRRKDLIFALCVVDFHHIRGPEIEYWCDSNTDSTSQLDQIKKYTQIWPNLPFQLLPDGAHLFEETFSTFTLLYDEANDAAPIESGGNDEEDDDDSKDVTTLFGCACIRQLNSSELIDKNDEITRSIVQKSVVLISRYPITIQLTEKLSIITKSFFLQRSFQDKSVIKQLYDNISTIYNNANTKIQNDKMEIESFNYDLSNYTGGEVLYESDFYMGLTLKEMILKYKRNLLVMFKLVLLEKRIIFFSKNLLKLSNFQFSLLSLIPNLIMNLQDCGSPYLANLSRDLKEPDSFNILDRGSILKFIGLPLQIFNKGGFFEPYLSLQQLDQLHKLDWYLIGTSNDLLLDQKQKICDLMIYIDNHNDVLEFINPEFEKLLQLTSQDKRFMDNLIKQVERLMMTTSSSNNSNKLDEEEKSGLNNTSAIYNDIIIEDLIRTSFENYLIGFLASVKYDEYLGKLNHTQLQSLQEDLGNNINQFNRKFVDNWKLSKNYEIFELSSYNEFFTMNEFKPKHVGGEFNLNIVKFWNQQRERFKGTPWNNTNNNSTENNTNNSATAVDNDNSNNDKNVVNVPKESSSTGGGFMKTLTNWAASGNNGGNYKNINDDTNLQQQ